MAAFPPPPPWADGIATAGVTGTNGKTTTVTWLAAALGSLREPVARVTTVGSWVGERALGMATDYDRFLQVLEACHRAGGRFAAIELTSAALAAGFLSGWPCEVGVFTNLSLDHLEMHGSAEHYLASKAQLFVSLPDRGTAVLNACDPASELLDEVTPPGVRRLTYSLPSRGPAQLETRLHAVVSGMGLDGTRLELSTRGLEGEWPTTLTLRAIGEPYAENALAALLGAFALGAEPRSAARAIELTPAPPGRFEVVRREPVVVVDYAHSPDALRRTVATARALCKGGLHVVFGAGGGPIKSKRAPLGEAARLADRVTLTSDNPRGEDPAAIAAEVQQGLAGHPGVTLELDRRRAIEGALELARADDLVLVAGKGHETEQTHAGTTRPFSDADVVRAWRSA